MFDHALCEEPTGDKAFYEDDVDCADCLDLLESGEAAWHEPQIQPTLSTRRYGA
jgi:hypothetical protein